MVKLVSLHVLILYRCNCGLNDLFDDFMPHLQLIYGYEKTDDDKDDDEIKQVLYPEDEDSFTPRTS